MKRDQLSIHMKEQDVRSLEEAVRIVRRRRTIAPGRGMTREAYCSVLLAEIDAIKDEIRRLGGLA